LNYNKTIEYIFSNLPLFQNIGKDAYKAGLENIYNFLNIIGNPQNSFKSVHVGGTNGKGSVSHFLASVLQEYGLKVGLFTSPHLKDFRERIKINGKMISKRDVTNFIHKYKNYFDTIKPSFFEMTTAMAFDYFSKQKVDIAVIEVGLGGRLDSTNVINPIISVITNISFDHTDILGNTLPKIAEEKAGIIKENITTVIGESNDKTDLVFISKANEKNSKLIFADKIMWAQSTDNKNSDYLTINIYKDKNIEIQNLEIALKGEYQLKNSVTAIAAIKELKTSGYDINIEKIKNGFKNVIENTGLMGRWQIVQKKPKIIADTGHNIAGFEYTTKQILKEEYENLYFILGFVKDKDISAILKILPENAYYFFTKANVVRALDEKLLYQKALEFNLKGEPVPSVSEAIKKAKKKMKNNDLLFIGGSTFIVAEAL
jgi:dihydrofolate synthase/folylpolyglutamate synthase